MKKFFIPFLIGLVCISSCKSTSEIVSLKLQMPVGNTYDYNFVMDMGMDEQVMGQAMKMNNKLTFAYKFEVLKDSAGWKTLRSTVGRMRMDMSMMGTNLTVDTNEPLADTTSPMAPLHRAFSAIKGQQFTFTIDERGKMGSVTGLDEMRKAVMQGIPGGEKMDQQMQSTFSEQSFKENMEQSFNIFPDKDVAVGDSWKKTIGLKSQGGNTKSENTFTLESVKEGKAYIKVKTNINGSKETTATGTEVTTKGSGDGVYVYEQATGIVLDGNIKMKMEMEMAMQGQKVPMKMDMNIKINGKKH